MKKLEFVVEGWWITTYFGYNEEVVGELECIGYNVTDKELQEKYCQFINNELKVAIIVVNE